MSKEQNNRIIKNTVFLYIRMLLMIVITLYTSRVVLNTLGILDFGIYSVVASIVTMLGFISSAMITATQRFLSFELGQNNKEKLSDTFIMSININVIITFIMFMLIGLLGIWFINNELNIPKDKLPAALWAFKCVLISFSFTLISIPYTSNIVAHEKLNIYAIISILDAALKLLILFLINDSETEKLKTYSTLMMVVSIFISITNIIYNRINYSFTKFRFFWNTLLFKRLLSYTGWNFFGALAGVFTNQCSNILINIFFGPAVNASKAITSQINSAIYGFVTAIQLSMSPQIVKTYSVGDKTRTKSLVFIGSKYSYFFALLIASPMILKMSLVLNLWLVSIPDYAIIFSKLVIIDSLIISLSNSLISSCNATGKIKLYQFVVGTITLLNIPISYYMLSLDSPPETVFYISIILSICSLIARVVLLKRIDKEIILGFEKNVIIPVILVSFFSSILLYFLNRHIPDTFLGLIILSVISSVVIFSFIWLLGMKTSEKSFLIQFIKNKIKSI
ncbi:TPA: lipopolysaccharide biosynthesis protein [Providencia rettgeri]